MVQKKLRTGVAYYGNRMPSHTQLDMEELARADMDIVVHMLTHIDWARNKKAMKENVRITKELGMEAWVDNWGLAGSPGETTYFLALHPEARMIFSDGQPQPIMPCLNNPDYRQFMHDWIDAAAEIGGEAIFWDEPYIPAKRIIPGNNELSNRPYCCTCPSCQRIFEERYNRKMPPVMDEDVVEFRAHTVADYYREMTNHSGKLGMRNATCVMQSGQVGINLEQLSLLGALPHMDSLGSDPYWQHLHSTTGLPDGPYEYVYNKTKKSIEKSDEVGKDHNIWIQAYAHKRGHEEEIIEAVHAAYDAGARTLLAWSFHGAESNQSAAENPRKTWNMLVEAFKRIKAEERDRRLAELRERYKK